jgi:hypothetical protein
MRNKNFMLTISICLFCIGCQKNDIWYNAVFDNTTDTYLHDGKVTGWPGVLGPGGNYIGLTIPVPDEISITWNSIKPGKEEIYRKHKEAVEQIVQENLKATENSDKVIIPEIPDPPEGIFEPHKVVLVLKGKVPKKPKNGEILITYTGDENFDIEYIEKPNDSNP